MHIHSLVTTGLLGLALTGVVSGQSRSSGQAHLELAILEADGDEPAYARVRVRDAQNADHVPPGLLAVNIGRRDRWFVCPGKCSLALEPGPIDLRVECGTEYAPYREKLELARDSTRQHVVRLSRWINMRERGYVCGEDHLHVPPEQLGPQILAERLDFGTSLQWWNGPKSNVVPGESYVSELICGSRRVPSTVFDFEIEYDWGSVYAIGVPAPLDAPPDPHRPNLPLVRRAHDAGALICYQGGWSQEVLLDALLGLVDGVEVCNNNFHRHQFQPRSRYSNLLNVPGLPVYPDTPEGMMRMNTETYYRLLNCGLRLAAGAGSATGPKNTPVGYNRTYVRAGRNPTLPQYLAAWKAGRNFVTNGPMLFLEVDRKEPGETIALAGDGGEVTIRAHALSQQSLTSLEIVSNGKVIAAAGAVGGHRAEISTRFTVREPCWITARATETDNWLGDQELAADHTYGGNLPCRPCRLRFAHTSPVYVSLDGRSTRVSQSVDEAWRILDGFESLARRNATEAYRGEIASALARARQMLHGGS
jgi:hypothetical protein